MFPEERPGRVPAGPGSRRGWTIMGGVAVTLVGVLAVYASFPFDSPDAGRALAALALGVWGLWLGGILLGFGLGRRSPGGPAR